MAETVRRQVRSPSAVRKAAPGLGGGGARGRVSSWSNQFLGWRPDGWLTLRDEVTAAGELRRRQLPGLHWASQRIPS